MKLGFADSMLNAPGMGESDLEGVDVDVVMLLCEKRGGHWFDCRKTPRLLGN